MDKKLKIGIDFHGVISAEPENFCVFCRQMRRLGVMVYIISGGPEADIRDFLLKHDIEFDVVWAITDYYCARGEALSYEDGGFFVPTELWNKAKAEYCAKEGILFHIDDSPVYGRHFVTPYCKYDFKKGVCLLNQGVKIDFANPETAADEVTRILKEGIL